jgi:glutathione S-transferase
MTLKLYFHPLASYCHKALIALYENDTPFEKLVVDLGNEQSRAEFAALWPLAKFPVLRDEARNQTVPESSIIIEYLAQYYPGKAALVGANADQARDIRLRDRFFDLHVHEHMQKIVGDKLRPPGCNDPHGVEYAKRQLQTAYGMLEQDMKTRTWAMGEELTMADCAAAPALFYANFVEPFGDAHPNLAAYSKRLQQRPSYARVLEEAQPYFKYFPYYDRM